jgi:hypothetical protein
VLSCKTQTNLVNAETYFDEHLRVGDYYGQDGQTLGQWHGLGAEKIGLRNTIQRDEFLQLCQNLNPTTGERLTQRHKTTRLESGHEVANRRIFYDFTFSPPKSVSLLALVAQDRRLIEAHVDYANVFASLGKALAIYGAGKDGKNPVKDKAKLVADLRHAIDAATTFCATRQVILAAVEQLATGSMERLQRMDDAVNALISPDPLRRDYLAHERLVGTLYSAVKPDPAALEFAGRVATIAAIAEARCLNRCVLSVTHKRRAMGIKGFARQSRDARMGRSGPSRHPHTVSDAMMVSNSA